MSVIDAHSHIVRFKVDVSEEIARRMIGHLAQYPCWREPSRHWITEDFNATYEECLEDMDRAGIDKRILMGASHYLPSFPESGWSHIKNDYIAEAQNKYPDRFIGFASIDPRGGAVSVHEIDRAISELGLKGIGEFTVAYAGLALDDEILDPIYRRCEELARERGTPLAIHTGFTGFPWTYLEIQDSALLWHVLEKFPGLKIIVSHAGWGGTWDHALHLAMGWPNVYLDFSSLGSVYPPFKIMEFLQQAKWAGVLDRCLWSTDFPWFDAKEELNMYRKFPAESKKLGREPLLTDEDIKMFLGSNAEKFLGGIK